MASEHTKNLVEFLDQEAPDEIAELRASFPTVDKEEFDAVRHLGDQDDDTVRRFHATLALKSLRRVSRMSAKALQVANGKLKRARRIDAIGNVLRSFASPASAALGAYLAGTSTAEWKVVTGGILLTLAVFGAVSSAMRTNITGSAGSLLKNYEALLEQQAKVEPLMNALEAWTYAAAGVNTKPIVGLVDKADTVVGEIRKLAQTM